MFNVVSVEDWQTICTFELESPGFVWVHDEELMMEGQNPGESHRTLTSYPLNCGEPRLLGTVPAGHPHAFNPTSQELVMGRDRELVIRPLDSGFEGERVVGRHDDKINRVLWKPGRADRIVARDRLHHFRVWSIERGLERVLEVPEEAKGATINYDPSGRWLALGTPYGPFYLWDLDGPPDARPRRIIAQSEGTYRTGAAIDPRGRWLATPKEDVISFSPLEWPVVHVIPFSEGHVWWPLFTPDSKRLVVRTATHLAVLPLAPGLGERSIIELGGKGYQLSLSPDGRFVATTITKAGDNSVIILPPPRIRPARPTNNCSRLSIWRLGRSEHILSSIPRTRSPTSKLTEGLACFCSPQMAAC
jgi:WD40 repeat protein